jgi:hypothetical protein
MNASFLFLTGVGLTAVLALIVVAYIRKPLRRFLVELCGNQERAEYSGRSFLT